MGKRVGNKLHELISVHHIAPQISTALSLSLTLCLSLSQSVAISAATNILGNWPGAMSRKGEVKGVIHVQHGEEDGVSQRLIFVIGVQFKTHVHN